MALSWPRLSPGAAAVGRLRLLGAAAFALHGSALDVGQTGALRVANVRLEFQLKSDS